MSKIRIRNYEEFWPFYLREHAHPVSRRLHFLGTSVAVASLIAAIATNNLWFLLPLLVRAYEFVWIGHFVFEKNWPACFKYPFWSVFSDIRMYFLWLTRGLDAELRRAGVILEK